MKRYHYTESGLDNVYLDGGFTLHDTPYGEGMSIHDTAGLHRAIGRWLIEVPKRLTGAELRFLRIDMDVTQRCLGDLLGSTEQCVQRWERARTRDIPGPADRLSRALYGEYANGDGSVRRMVDRLAALDEVPHPTALLHRNQGGGWEIERQLAA